MDRLRGDPGKRCVESIGGKTRLLALIERPDEHGPSPRMRGASFVADGLNCVCVALNVEPEYLPTAVKGAAAFRLRGFNITVSHKRAMPPLLDEVIPYARVGFHYQRSRQGALEPGPWGVSPVLWVATQVGVTVAYRYAVETSAKQSGEGAGFCSNCRQTSVARSRCRRYRLPSNFLLL